MTEISSIESLPGIEFLKARGLTEKGSLNFRIDNSSLCQGTALRFVNESVCLWGSMSYEWDFGDGTRSTQANPVKTYNGTGTSVYTVMTTPLTCPKHYLIRDLFLFSCYTGMARSIIATSHAVIPKKLFIFFIVIAF